MSKFRLEITHISKFLLATVKKIGTHCVHVGSLQCLIMAISKAKVIEIK